MATAADPVDRAARAAEPGLKRVVRDAVVALRASVNRQQLGVFIARGDPGGVLSAFDWPLFESKLALALPVVRATMDRTARHTAKVIGVSMRKADPVITGSLRLSNPSAIRLAARIAARLVRTVTLETQQAIRAVIVRALSEGVAVPQQADLIAEILMEVAGLTERQALALQNYRRGLEAKGVQPADIARFAQAQRDRYIRQRAEMIARTETVAAANGGQQATWQEAVREGFLPPDAKRRWMTALDERVCVVCFPMDGQVRGIDEPFQSPATGETWEIPPAHVSCRCAMSLDPESL